jgi:hypothetical protein
VEKDSRGDKKKSEIIERINGAKVELLNVQKMA